MRLNRNQKLFRVVITQLLLLVLVFSLASFANTVIPNSVPPYLAQSQNLGPEDPSRVISISMRLSLRDRSGRDTLLRDLYDRHSQQYQKWLTPDQFASRFAPTAQQVATVQSFLHSQNLTVTAVNRHNYTVTAQGRVADIERAFGVQINR
jgi:subtilase family serine protease